MRLLMTRFGAFGLRKNNLIYFIDIETGKEILTNLFYDLLNKNDLYNCFGATYSGNWLCVGINNLKVSKSYLFLHNFIDNKIPSKLVELPLSYNIFDIISVYPGQLYLCSEGTHSLNNVSFSPDSGKFWSDVIHYKLPPNLINFCSLCSYQMRWYGAINNSIVELTNDRIIYSDLNNPHNVFFNHNNRLCFLEKNKFYCGDNIFYFNNDVFSVYEDIVKAGYWLCTKNNLIFINYFGEKINYIPIKESSTFKMIEIRGNLNETF